MEINPQAAHPMPLNYHCIIVRSTFLAIIKLQSIIAHLGVEQLVYARQMKGWLD